VNKKSSSRKFRSYNKKGSYKKLRSK
jgi:hypothetical protein